MCVVRIAGEKEEKKKKKITQENPNKPVDKTASEFFSAVYQSLVR